MAALKIVSYPKGTQKCSFTLVSSATAPRLCLLSRSNSCVHAVVRCSTSCIRALSRCTSQGGIEQNPWSMRLFLPRLNKKSTSCTCTSPTGKGLNMDVATIISSNNTGLAMRPTSGVAYYGILTLTLTTALS